MVVRESHQALAFDWQQAADGGVCHILHQRKISPAGSGFGVELRIAFTARLYTAVLHVVFVADHIHSPIRART